MPRIPMISIVDDDDAVREATKGLVRSLGYHASTFSSAEEFLNSERLHDTSCLITDLQMPGLSGMELQGRLIASGHSMPIIFITAHGEGNVKMQALTAGAVEFLSKPFDDDVLLEKVRAALEMNPPFARE